MTDPLSELYKQERLDRNERRLKIQEEYRQRKAAMQLTFSGPHGQAVLNDLRRFCLANRDCFDTDPYAHAANSGRRQVWLFIDQYLRLSLEELFTAIPTDSGDRDDD